MRAEMLAMLKVSIEEAIPVMECMLSATQDRVTRNMLALRLATLDQRLAAVTEKLAGGVVGV